VEKEEVEEIAKQYEAYIEKEQEKIAPEERWRTTMQSRFGNIERRIEALAVELQPGKLERKMALFQQKVQGQLGEILDRLHSVDGGENPPVNRPADSPLRMDSRSEPDSPGRRSARRPGSSPRGGAGGAGARGSIVPSTAEEPAPAERRPAPADRRSVAAPQARGARGARASMAAQPDTSGGRTDRSGGGKRKSIISWGSH